MTTVMITNNVEEAMLLSDRIVPMLPARRRRSARRFRWSCRGRARVAQLAHDEQATHVRAHVVATLTAALGRRRPATPAGTATAAGACAPSPEETR